MYEVYVEQYFAPMTGCRGYSSEIRVFPELTEIQAKEMVKELKCEWESTEGFYVGSRTMRVKKA